MKPRTSELVKKVLPALALPLLRPVYHCAFRAWVRVWCGCVGLWDPLAARRSGIPALPPAALRYRVGQSPYVSTFLTVGRMAAENLRAALVRAGRPLETFDSILDFGCGCGRTLVWLARGNSSHRFYGTDVDGAAIAWCRANQKFAEFHRNAPLPPLPYGDGKFDLVYAISVFTHLDEDLQSRWFAELRRVVRSGGLLILSVHGQAVWRELCDADRSQLEQRGFLFQRSGKCRGIFPPWYQTSFHAEGYIREQLGGHFRILEYLAEGMGYQDLVVAAAE